MKTTWTEADFDEMSWHDCCVWGLEIHKGDTDEDDWTSELALDIDFIVEWPKSCDGCDFLLAPAMLVFQGVTNLSINIDLRNSECRTLVPNPPSINRIEREDLPGRPDYPDWRQYAWCILFHDQQGLITFDATGFTQILTGQPVNKYHVQQIPWRERERLKKGLI